MPRINIAFKTIHKKNKSDIVLFFLGSANEKNCSKTAKRKHHNKSLVKKQDKRAILHEESSSSSEEEAQVTIVKKVKVKGFGFNYVSHKFTFCYK